MFPQDAGKINHKSKQNKTQKPHKNFCLAEVSLVSASTKLSIVFMLFLTCYSSTPHLGAFLLWEAGSTSCRWYVQYDQETTLFWTEIGYLTSTPDAYIQLALLIYVWL